MLFCPDCRGLTNPSSSLCSRCESFFSSQRIVADGGEQAGRVEALDPDELGELVSDIWVERGAETRLATKGSELYLTTTSSSLRVSPTSTASMPTM
ncbi:MAG: hypothetical protein SXQ77_04000 [Halobacteria archaeon]|nr:hypothetical protein [Halobacteria archaeon]